MDYDFSGWATRANIKCSDGVTIMKGAFSGQNGQKVPLVWNHVHDNPDNVLGHAVLEDRNGDMYAYCSFNGTPKGQHAKAMVEHGDIEALSIYANKIKRAASNVTHGLIREVSLVMAGANPGAFIDSVVTHGDNSDESATIYTGEYIILHSADEVEEKPEEEIEHADKKKTKDDSDKAGKGKKMDENERTVQDVIDSMTEEQQDVLYALVGEARGDEEEEGGAEMKHNAFEDEMETNDVLCQADMEEIFADARRYGSLKDAVLAHGIEEVNTLTHSMTDANGNTVDYGFANMDYLFPEARNLNSPPEFIKREMGWVSKVMNSVHHSPFSRVKSMFADITGDDARALGYIKGNLKKEEVFTLLKRSTTPTTIYKKQKLDRDDAVDITDFDVVVWLKAEMRMMLNEELARAILVGDGRLSSSDDKINEQHIRPVWKDADLYTIKKTVSVAANATDDQKAKAFIRACVKSRKDYKGSGNPTLYTTEDLVTDCLLMEDAQGRVIYDSMDKLKTALRVSDIITVPIMENLSRTVDGVDRPLLGIIVNLHDYNVGADNGGAINMFDDFDIDYNQMKYLIETRCSGALIKPYSAIVLEQVTA